jgi:enoyl-CoA hydratase/carnithine racemase
VTDHDFSVRTERETGSPGVSIVTIARESRRNALSVELCRELTEVLHREADDADIGIIVLTGTPPAFCAGADFGDFEAGPERGGFVPAFHELLSALAHVEIPVMAWVDGPAIGAGCQIVAQCDLSVASDVSTFGITAAKIGLQVDMPNVNRLVCEIGPTAARRLLLTGDVIDAEEALRLGLVNRVVPEAQTRQVALSWAADIASRAPMSVRGHKAAIQAIVDGWWLPESAGSYQASVEASLRSFLSEDLREGLSAFAERRDPEFRGR